MLNTVLFDLDGTLVQHGHVLLPELLATWQEDRELPVIEKAFARQILWFYDHVAEAESQGWVDVLFHRFYARILGQLNIPDADGSRARSVHEFFSASPVPPLFDDVVAVLDRLRAEGWRMGIITQRSREGATRFMQAHNLAETFPVLIAGDDGLGRKPDANPFHVALDKLNTTPSQAIFVGDRIDDDCEGAINAGMEAFLIDRDNAYGQTGLNKVGYTLLASLDQLLYYLPTPTENGRNAP